MAKNKIEYFLTREIGIIPGDNSGWDKRLTLGRWGQNGEEKYNLRVHSPDGKPIKGVTFTLEELIELRDLIDEEIENM